MKRFLYRDQSGRGFTAQWSIDEIVAECADGGVFSEYAHDDYDCDTEGLLTWLERCGSGDEFDLEAADLVCVVDDGAAPAFKVEASADGATLVLRSPIGELVATLTMAEHTHALPADVGARLGANWRALVRLLTTAIQ